jgi:hypothetical protein
MSSQEAKEKYCKYCELAVTLTDEDQMLCSRYGVVSSSHCCRRFRYDPMKRVPARNRQKPQLDYVDVD